MTRSRRRRGFSLIEVLVSLVILTASLIGILQGLVLAARAVAANTDRQQALALLAAQASTVRLGLLTDGALPAAAAGSFAPPHDAFRWELVAHAEAAHGAAHHVELAVAWRRGQRQRREIAAWDCWIPGAVP